MIFITVGTQLPFDRLVRSMDLWASAHPQVPIFAQIGTAARHLPVAFPSVACLSARDFQDNVRQADLVVSHAGVGSILTALDLARPILVLPRLARFGEHRNDHQVGTAKALGDRGLVTIAHDEGELSGRLDELLDGARRTARDGTPNPLVRTLGYYLRARQQA